MEFVEKMNRVLLIESKVGEKVVEVPNEEIAEVSESPEQVTKDELPQVNESENEILKVPLEVIDEHSQVQEEINEKTPQIMSEWVDDTTDTASFVSFSPVRLEVIDSSFCPAPHSEDIITTFKIVAVESIKRENSEVDRRNEALVSLYKKKMKKKCQELELCYQPYQKSPTSHASFAKQWKMFYIKENFAVLSSGVRDFNYKPAWNVYWVKHLQKLKNQELLEYEEDLRIKLNIPESVPITSITDFQDLSDISEDELEFQSLTKRRRTDEEPPAPVQKVFTDHDRMLIAYQLAYEHFREDKKLSPEQLSELVSSYCSQQAPEPLIASQLSSSSQHLTDNDILVLYKKFNNLSPNEQANLISFVHSIEVTDPRRYKTLMYDLKRHDGWC